MPRVQSLRPTGTQVLIAPCTEETENKTASGIILPNSNLKKEPPAGIIKSKGDGNQHNDMSDIIVGNRVRYKRGAGTKITVNEIDYWVIDYSDLLWTE